MSGAEAPVRTPIAGRAIAVTGALGFVASHLIPRLQASGARVIAIVRPGRDASRLTGAGCTVREADLSSGGSLAGAFDQAQSLVHLSGIAQADWLVPALEAAGVRRAVFVGSAGVHTRLVSPGADAKRAGEARLRASALEYVILRPSMIYGTARDRNLVRLLRWIGRFPVVPVPGGGATPQQPVHVEDLCAAILAALERNAAARREYDLGGPAALSLAELVRESARALGRPVWLMPVPLGPAHQLARIARSVRAPFPVSPEQVLRLAESKAVDITPARVELGFEPRTFAAGIAAEASALLAGIGSAAESA